MFYSFCSDTPLLPYVLHSVANFYSFDITFSFSMFSWYKKALPEPHLARSKTAVYFVLYSECATWGVMRCVNFVLLVYIVEPVNISIVVKLLFYQAWRILLHCAGHYWIKN